MFGHESHILAVQQNAAALVVYHPQQVMWVRNHIYYTRSAAD
jgi:hypothetical protein